MLINQEMTELSEFQLSQQRLGVVTRLMEKWKREVDLLRQQVALLTTSNNELSEYARLFHLDEEKEAESVAAAVEETVESAADLETLAELDDTEGLSSDDADLLDSLDDLDDMDELS